MLAQGVATGRRVDTGGKERVGGKYVLSCISLDRLCLTLKPPTTEDRQGIKIKTVFVGVRHDIIKGKEGGVGQLIDQCVARDVKMYGTQGVSIQRPACENKDPRKSGDTQE